MKLLRYAALLVLGVNIWMLSQVAINRYWGDTQRFEFTERELAMAGRHSHDASRSVYLRWRGNSPEFGYYSSRTLELGGDAFRALQFSPEACRARQASRDGFALFIYQGEPYQTLLARYRQNLAEAQTRALGGREEDIQKLERAKQLLANQQLSASRLIAVDVARNRDELSARATSYDAPSLILPARIQPLDDCETTRVTVSINSATHFHLSRAQTDGLDLAPTVVRYNRPNEAPRYRVSLAIGSLGMPWVEEISRCEGECEINKGRRLAP
ncbi:DUF4824 family protein [Gilvimarinus sp. DA14]|uniref:DUF4824 family protein n=1 Tax=Gilvimarinus sp. DA14 TaxID=2956798 RepID=UPI0020B82F86|nr:DUF4824 family protein [Gilvimarinus sp. DA14]UTF58561.1 DUF4824 family protein [Gilvimarinus sp. DA14]